MKANSLITLHETELDKFNLDYYFFFSLKLFHFILQFELTCFDVVGPCKPEQTKRCTHCRWPLQQADD